MHRHNWRKLAPDKRHPQSNPVAQADWEKNSPKRSPKSARTEQETNRSD
ncbi:winged helix-turn-helix domain-containing protein [Candidatus Nitrotoga sp. AM1P]